MPDVDCRNLGLSITDTTSIMDDFSGDLLLSELSASSELDFLAGPVHSKVASTTSTTWRLRNHSWAQGLAALTPAPLSQVDKSLANKPGIVSMTKKQGIVPGSDCSVLNASSLVERHVHHIKRHLCGINLCQTGLPSQCISSQFDTEQLGPLMIGCLLFSPLIQLGCVG